MKRRQFITLLGGTVAAWPLAARAQQSVPVIGVLSATQPNAFQLRALWQGLGETGYLEGRNVTIEIRSADGQYDRLPALAAELVARGVNVIAALYSPVPARAAKAATKTIPIVFLYGGDPVEDGLVASLNRPGGNVTGMTFIIAALTAKRLEVLRELVPKATMIGVLINSANQLVETQLKDLQVAARTLGQAVHVETASNEAEIEAAFEALVRQGAGALLVGAELLLLQPPRSSYRAGGTSCASHNLLGARNANGRRPDKLRRQHWRRAQASRRLHRPNSQRCETRRPSRHAANQVRIGDQSQDRQGARPRQCRRRCSSRADEVIE